MLIQLFLNIFSFFLKIVLWLVIGFAAIPFGTYVLFLNIFPNFTSEGGFWFWGIFAPLNMAAFYFLWSPILWTVHTITALFEKNEVPEHF